jgi:hypothetical protein
VKAALMFTASGPLVILTSHASLTAAPLLAKLSAKGIHKFIAYEVPVEIVEKRYGHHFQVVVQDLHETDELRVLDENGYRAFQLIHFGELGEPIMHEGLAQSHA